MLSLPICLANQHINGVFTITFSWAIHNIKRKHIVYTTVNTKEIYENSCSLFLLLSRYSIIIPVIKKIFSKIITFPKVTS